MSTGVIVILATLGLMIAFMLYPRRKEEHGFMKKRFYCLLAAVLMAGACICVPVAEVKAEDGYNIVIMMIGTTVMIVQRIWFWICLM